GDRPPARRDAQRCERRVGERRGRGDAVGTLHLFVDDELNRPTPVADGTVMPTPGASHGGIDDLVARVRERGFVTTGEIFAALPDLEPDTAELAAIYTGLEANG